ncbi:hypothetical protein [Neobacillus dielmonensis]|nr:hypothetical protein [Neobacillus dielmonensis]
MVAYQVHRSAEYHDYRESRLKVFEKKKGILQKRLQRLKAQT